MSASNQIPPVAPVQLNQAAAVAAPAPNFGGPALLNLWLLLTTNPTFLLQGVAESVSADNTANAPLGTTLVTLRPGAGDTIPNWATLIGALQNQNTNASLFGQAKLNTFLTQGLQTGFLLDSDGNPTISYATALQNASAVFQSIAHNFETAWPRTCPPTIGETLGLP